MCLLIYASPNSTPSKKALRRAGLNNPDGFGFAFALDNRIVRHRSMKLDDTIDLFHEMRAAHPKAHAIFHLRITTHGGTNIDNCHPFMVTDQVVLGHNGMLPIKETPDGRSDTRQFAEEWLPTFGIKEMLDDPENFKELEKFARGSKLAILSVDEQLDRDVYLVNENDGHWKNGVWYSNHSYEYEPMTTWNYRAMSSIASHLTPTDDNSWLPDEHDIEDGFWFDHETGELFQWDERHGWMLYTDDDEDHVPEWCAMCDADLSMGVYQDRYCYDCGSCSVCNRLYGDCFCGVSKKGGK